VTMLGMRAWSPRCALMAIPAVFGLGCGGNDGGCQAGTGPDCPFHTVTVVEGSGVEGDPAPGRLSYRSDTTISYQFLLKANYENLLVALDGRLIPSHGSFTMDQDRLLIASADSVVRLAEEVRPIYESVQALLRSPDPAGAYQDLLAQELASAQNVGLAEATHRLEVASYFAIDPVADSVSVRQLEEALVGSAFRVRPAGPSAMVATKTAQTLSAKGKPTTLLFMNGIANTPVEALISFVELTNVAHESPASFDFESPDTPYSAMYLYNPTATRDPVILCLLRAIQPSWFSYLAVNQSIARCLPSALQDIDKSIGQIATQFLDFRGDLTKEGHKLADAVVGEIAAGRDVILVVHSQGNLMAQEALKIVEQELPSTALACIAVISVATPKGGPTSGWPSEVLPVLDGLIVKGTRVKDAMLYIPGPLNTFTPLSTDISDRLDGPIEQFLDVSNAGSTEVMQYGLVEAAFKLHSFVSYLNGEPSRTRFKEHLVAFQQSLASRCHDAVLISPAVVTLGVGQTFLLTADVTDPLGQKPSAPNVNWSSSNPQVATVNANGLISGVGPGTVTISASYQGQEGTALVTVNGVEPPLPLVVTSAASAVTSGSAVLNGTVNPNGLFTSAWFEWGTDPSLNPSQSSTPEPVGSGGTSVPVSLGIVNFDAGTTYYFHAVAGNSAGTARGAILSFQTLNQNPSIALNPVSIEFTALPGGPNPAAETVSVTNGGAGSLSGLSVADVSYTAGQATGWLTTSLSSSVAPATLTLQATTTTLGLGTYSANVSVASGSAENSPQIVSVSLTVSSGIFATSALTDVLGRSSPPSDLYVTEPSASGRDILVGRVRTGDGSTPLITDVALSPSGLLYGISYRTLYSVSPENATAVQIGSLGLSNDANGLAFDRDGNLFGATVNGSYFRVDIATGHATVLGSFGGGLGSDGDIVFAPDGTLFGAGRTADSKSILVTVNRNTGQATPVVPSATLGFNDVWGLTYFEDQLFGLTTDVTTATGVLVRIDTSLGTATFVRSLTFDATGAAASTAATE
jgi:hypothetical protein